nr:restriction endonuclease subunit S [Trichocoleus sp. FACHB-832]
MNCGGAFLREKKTGSQIAATSLAQVKAGDFIYSRLFAWGGAFAIIGSNLDGCYVSGEFPTFLPVSEQINIKFLRLWFCLPEVLSKVEADCTGSTPLTRNRFKEQFFLALEIPLPPLEEQQRIVARVEELVGKMEEVRSLRQQALKQTEVLQIVESTKLFSNTPTNGYLADVLYGKPRNGWSARCNNMPGGIAVLSLGAVTGFSYRETEFKRTSELVSHDAHYWLKPGDLLITRSNTPELVGHAAIYNGSPFPCIYPDLMMRLDVNESKADKKFVHRWLTCTPVRDYIKSKAKGTSPTMKKISQEIVMNIPFPSDVSLLQQRRIVSYLHELQTKVDTIKQLRGQAINELDALLPSILDKAFKGEL